jgi:hypothetical protein
MFYTNDKGYQQILREAIQYRILRRTLEVAKRAAGDSDPLDNTEITSVGLSRVFEALAT